MTVGTGNAFLVKLGNTKKASATAVLSTTTVGSVTVVDGGKGYQSAPTISFTGGGGSGATATATIDANGTITAISVDTAGTGYTSAPTVVITPTYVKVAAQTQTQIAQSANPVDTSNKDDDGWGSILEGGGRKNITITSTLFFKDDATQNAITTAFDDQSSGEWEIASGVGDTWKGTFIVTQLQEQGTAFGAETWQATFQNVGAPTYTAPA